MSKRTYIDYITDIAEELERIEKFVEGLSYEEFRKDVKTVYAVIRWLVHGYFGVDHEILWETIKKRIPEVKSLIRWDFRGYGEKINVELNKSWQN